MITYIFLYIIFIIFSNIFIISKDFRNKYSKIAYLISISILFFIIAFRYKTGADWEPYVERMDELFGESVLVAYKQDMLYGLIEWFGSNVFGGIYLINFISTFIIIYFMYKFLSVIENYWLGTIVLLQPYFIYIAMNQVRQGIAIAILAYAIAYMMKYNSKIMPVALMILSVNFHKSAIFFCCILIIFMIINSNKKLLLLIVSTLVLFIIFTQNIDYIDDRFEFYSYNTIDNIFSFFLLRILLCLISGFIVIANLRKKWRDNKVELFYAASVFIIPFLFIVFPSGIIFIERLATYWIPLLAIAGSYLTCKKTSPNLLITNSVSILSLFLFLLWVYSSSVSEFWIPYQNIIFNF